MIVTFCIVLSLSVAGVYYILLTSNINSVHDAIGDVRSVVYSIAEENFLLQSAWDDKYCCPAFRVVIAHLDTSNNVSSLSLEVYNLEVIITSCLSQEENIVH